MFRKKRGCFRQKKRGGKPYVKLVAGKRKVLVAPFTSEAKAQKAFRSVIKRMDRDLKITYILRGTDGFMMSLVPRLSPKDTNILVNTLDEMVPAGEDKMSKLSAIGMMVWAHRQATN